MCADENLSNTMHNTYNYKVQLENVDANNPGTLGCFYRKCNPD